MTRGKKAILAIGIGVVAGILCYDILKATKANGDLWMALNAARDLVAGNDPYRTPRGPDDVPYPLTAALIAMPLSFFADPLPSGIFMGLSSGLLAWLILTFSKPWGLLLFLSWPFTYAFLFVQWTPLMACLWFLPILMPLVLVKPQIALPMLLTAKPDWRGVALTAAIGVLSIVVYPSWPWIWLRQIAGYQGTLPPLLVLPLGPLLALSLLRWRKRTAWLLFFMALMPQRVVYDQLCLMLVASNWRELLFLAAMSWITMPALLHYGGWPALPGGWQLWIVATLYIPALLVVLRSRKMDEPA